MHDARASPIDPARFGEELPHAALSLALKARGSDRGLEGTLVLENSAAGPLDQHQLPIARIDARAASKDRKASRAAEKPGC